MEENRGLYVSKKAYLKVVILLAAIVFLLKSYHTRDSLVEVEVSYGEDNEIDGSMNADDIDKYVRVVTLEQEGAQFQKLMYVEDYLIVGNGINSGEVATRYIDFESSWSMIDYKDLRYSYVYDEEADDKSEPFLNPKGNIQIIGEESFLYYLLEENFIQENYDITEMVEFYHEKVEPNFKFTSKSQQL